MVLDLLSGQIAALSVDVVVEVYPVLLEVDDVVVGEQMHALMNIAGDPSEPGNEVTNTRWWGSVDALQDFQALLDEQPPKVRRFQTGDVRDDSGEGAM